MYSIFKLTSCSAIFLLATLAATQNTVASELFMRDTMSDIGDEPYAGPGPIYLSPDIWVRQTPDPNHDPYPFPTASPPWTPQPHQNPEYRNTKRSLPNYVYVRIHNRGDEASDGTERLRLYQAKASTGLSWPSQWVDDTGFVCSADQLLGIEVTKPRINAQLATVTERRAYRDALNAIGSDPAYEYSDGVSYWHKQNEVHTNGNPIHGAPGFLPWHREMMGRLEQRLREVDPVVTLLYWDFTVDPTLNNATFDTLFDSNFMGPSNGTVNTAIVPLQPPTLSRNHNASSPNCVGFDDDSTLMGPSDYQDMAEDVEAWPNHDASHGCIGGSSGNISFLNTAAQDPFFFQLHGNVDRQWANWQRDGADPARLDPVAVYGSDSSDATITGTMAPWDGTSNAPWDGVGASTSKDSKHRSVVYPPIYDTAPLNIPVLQPGESVVIEIPWYPPNVNNFNCSGQAGHFCLLARIETEENTPYGMTFTEVSNVGTNTRNNNKIAWKNLTIVDTQSDGPAFMLTGTLIRNVFDRELPFQFRLIDRTLKRRFLLPEFAQVGIALPEEIIQRLREDDDILHDLKLTRAEGRKLPILQITGKEPYFTMPMKAGEVFTAELVVNINRGDLPKELLAEPFLFDIEQHIDLPRGFFENDELQALEVGGVRFTLDFAAAIKDRGKIKDRLNNADLKLNLKPVERKMFTQKGVAAPETQHLSLGEPVELRATDEQGTSTRQLMLEVDGREVAVIKNADQLVKVLAFDEAGVHTIEARSIAADGQVVQKRTRVLVSKSIPPDALIVTPGRRATVKVGETVMIEVDTVAAFQRKVVGVTMHVKEDGLFATGLDLVRNENYPSVDSREGPGPHRFEFMPEKPGNYMVQFGVTDDADQIGESGHLMLMVTK